MGDAYRVFAGYGALAFVLGLFWPLFHHRMKRYQHDNSWFGQTQSRFDAQYRDFAQPYVRAFGMILLAVVTAGFIAAVLVPEGAGRGNPLAFIAVVYVVVMIGAVGLMQPYLSGRLQNIIWNNTWLGAHRFRSDLSVRQLVRIQLSNLALIVVTLGFYWPWAVIRLARYRIESLALLPDGDLEAFVAAAGQDMQAFGDETAELFDLDIAL